VTSNAKRSPGTASVTVTSVLQRWIPLRLRPRNFAPGAGPSAPPTHLPPAFSFDHSPILGRSETSVQSVSADAAMSLETESESFIAAR